jgi:hypothetical protein
MMEPAMPRKNQIILSVFITFFMSLSMSGVMGFISVGPDFLSQWPRVWLMAWPIAFIVTQFVTPLAFKLTLMVAPLSKA